MRIAVNLSFLGNRYSGIATFAENLLECLLSMDHEVVAYASSPRFSSMSGITVRRTPEYFQIERGGLASLARFAWTQTTLPKLVLQDKAELFISPSVEGLLRPPIRQMLVVHDLLPLFYREENPRQYYYYRYVLPAILNNASQIIAVSEYTRNDVLNTYGLDPNQVKVASAGFKGKPGWQDESAAADERNPYFLFVGTFSPRKNVATVLEAFSQVSHKVPEDLIVVAYPDRWEGPIKELATSLGVAQRVHFRSGVPDESLRNLYRNATALVLLSEYEGMGLPPLEAMAVGTPVIVSDSSSLAEVVGSAGITVPCRDAATAGSAMCLLSSDSNVRQKYSQAGLRRASKYAREAAAMRLRECLEQFCHAGAGAY